MSTIRPDPELPRDIAEAAATGKLAIFIGAGVSRLAGCWGWDELAQKLIKNCLDSGHINYREAESLWNYTDYRKSLTICHRLLKEKGDLPLFYSTLTYALKKTPRIPVSSVYDEIHRIPALYVTTNYDELFDEKFRPEHILHDKNNWLSEVGTGRLFHIHGRIIDHSSIVVTLRHYLELYSDRRFTGLMSKILTSYRVLFIGYGMTELEIIEQVIRNHDAPSPRHWILQGFFAGEELLLDIERKYYGDLGIEMIAFAKDVRGYDELYYVMRDWARKITEIADHSSAVKTKLDGLIAEVDHE